MREGLQQATEVARKARQHWLKGLYNRKQREPLEPMVARPNYPNLWFLYLL